MRKLTILFCLIFISFSLFSQSLTVNRLKCEYKTNPLGIENKSPRFAWELGSLQRGVLQTAYRIIVSDIADFDQKNSSVVWDSRKVNSLSSIQVKYEGKPLVAGKKYFWKVIVWDNKGSQVSSKSNFFQMGLFNKEDWKGAKWIAYEKLPDSAVNNLVTDKKPDIIQGSNVLPLLRKQFTIKKKVKRAAAFIAGLGHFELSINGNKVDDHFLDAGWTKYDKEAQYVTFDITSKLKQGGNAIGVMLGNGFYYVPPVKGRYRKLKTAFGFPKMIARFQIEYTDGSTDNVVSDASWKTSSGPIIFSSIYGGEDYNANFEKIGWDTPGYNDRGWKSVIQVDGPPSLISQIQEPLKVFEQFAANTISQAKNGNWVYDLGQNFSGIVELKVKGKKGDTVRIIPAELLKADGSGSVNQRPTGSPFYFTYILKGDGVETWRPRFTYYGFRYLEVQGATPEGEGEGDKAIGSTLLALKGLHIRNAAEGAGSFTSSSDLFNRTNTLIDWSIKSNLASVMTDCPHREKLGWLEQVHLMGSSIRYQYDIANLSRKSIQDIKASQLPNGLVPEIAPEYVLFTWGGDMFRDSPEWASTLILMPWYLYNWYGDKNIIKDAYPAMKKYIAYLENKGKSSNYILSQGLGDWYDLGPNPPGVSQLTPLGVTGTAIFYHDLTVMDSIAQMLSLPEDAAKFRSLAGKVKESFNQKFFNKDTKQYSTGSQTANAMALYMNLVNPADRTAVLANLIKDIKDRGNALTAGDIGYRYLLRVLENEGRSDVIFAMNNRSDVPGYGYQLAKGATALTESWAALPTVSNNHLMLGHLMEWFYSGLGGIRSAQGSIAFKDIEINPQVVGDLSSAKVDYHSPYGLISSDWKKSSDRFEINVTVPANTTATIYLPATRAENIQEGGAALSAKNGAQLLGIKDGKALVRVGSGTYRFSATH
ncbi:family 78 glycoside hydrolase catalytic domain [Desertivirga arenae]|uniref:family 78 glycoside hydrolase catalytic domain n=1 Tax=Desertivirga arenae TaxID=2810309 RepID=UPI001A95B097|nr:family 78 glycoside hydrolase catalytic domain [Pedobacter sp. SYSU D00823]